MNSIKKLSFGSTIVTFRNDGFLNATQIAKHFNKRPNDYLNLEQTQQYIQALIEHYCTTKNIVVKYNQLVSVQNGGNNRGTWLHPKLAIHFARWLDPKFAVWCDEQIENLLSGNQAIQQPLPFEHQDFFTMFAKMTHYAGKYYQMQELLCHSPHNEQAKAVLNALAYSTSTNETGFLLVFKPNLKADIQQAVDWLHAHSQTL